MSASQPVPVSRKTFFIIVGTLLFATATVATLRTMYIAHGYLVAPFSMELHVKYATYADMMADGAKQRGWVPEFVPESATNFEECHNLDTNQSWLRFSLPPEDIDNLAKTLPPVSKSDVTFPLTPPAIAAPWWSEALTAGSGRTDAFQYFRFAYFSYIGDVKFPEHDFVAVDATTNTVWHWRP